MSSAIKATKELAEVAYQDAMQPGAKEFGLASRSAGQELGEAVTTVAKVANRALTPLKALIWCWDKIETFVVEQVEKRFKDKPDNLITPNPVVAVPALQALQYTGTSPTLRDMYMNLLATAMDKDTAVKAHPAFVEIIRQLSPDEARIMNRMADKKRPGPKPDKKGYAGHCGDIARESGCEVMELDIAYIDNLCRLGLLRDSLIPDGVIRTVGTGDGDVSITQFGINFCEACRPLSA